VQIFHLRYLLLLFLFISLTVATAQERKTDGVSLINSDKEKQSSTIHENYSNPFLGYKGKKVRNISIVVLDPFDNSVNERYGSSLNYLERTGNKLHISSKEKIVRNQLLFKAGRELDPLELSESERLLRLSPSIFDARIYVQKLSGKKNDSVDVMVVVQDKWSTLAGSRMDANAPDADFSEKNFLGYGHQIEGDIIWNNTAHTVNTSGKYSVFNIGKTHISAAVFYATIPENQQFGITAERLFYSPLSKWAGGISLIKNYTVFPQTDAGKELSTSSALNYNTYDLWGAKSFPLTQDRSASLDKRSSNFIIGARYFRLDYLDRPSFDIDVNHSNLNQQLYLMNFGFSKRKYYRDRYLFRYGANEDIPEGVSVEFVIGGLKKEITPVWYYSGFKFATGKHFENLGYLSGGVSYGSFYNTSFMGSGAVNLDGFYFSDLIKLHRWYFRQFSRFNFVEGIDRLPNENLNINGTQMYGFTSDGLSSKSKMVLNFEFVLYSPYKILGYQFAPVFFCGLAGMGINFGNMFSSQIYQAYAIGILIRNEYLNSGTFKISIGLYPVMPGNPDYTLKAIPGSSYDVKARDYFISKPDMVSYQ